MCIGIEFEASDLRSERECDNFRLCLRLQRTRERGAASGANMRKKKRAGVEKASISGFNTLRAQHLTAEICGSGKQEAGRGPESGARNSFNKTPAYSTRVHKKKE
jgi:hypothetical protein